MFSGGLVSKRNTVTLYKLQVSQIFILIPTSKLPQSLLTTLKQHQFFIFTANFLYFDNQISK